MSEWTQWVEDSFRFTAWLIVGNYVLTFFALAYAFGCKRRKNK